MEDNFIDPLMLVDGPENGSQNFHLPDLNDFQDPFAHVRETTGSLNTDTGLDCEIKAYETRYNAEGKVETLQVGRRRKVTLEKSSSLRAAIVLKRHYDKLDELSSTELRIQSPHIKKALRQVIREYPGLSLDAPTIVIHDIPKCLFHYRKELADYARSVRDEAAVQHLKFIQDYAYQQMIEQTFSYSLYMEFPGLEPGLEFPNLWMAFRPGDLIFMREGDVSRILLFESMVQNYDCWKIQATFIDSDGKSFGYRREDISIGSYDNYRPLVQLKTYPLDFHTGKQEIVEALCERGRKFISLQGMHYCCYQGSVRGPPPFDGRNDELDEDDEYDEYDEYDESQAEALSAATLATERIIIDTTGYRSNNPVYFTKTLGPCKGKRLKFEEKHLLMCTHEVPAFALSSRRWWKVKVEEVKEIDFNADAFNKLILPESQKEMIHSLVKVHANNLLKFDDVIAGKGKGMVFLLHGESGTGKTLTAESVADYTKRPLYVVGCADLGTTIATVERNLTKILRMSTEWNAILLLDEADVFLERRSTHDLERNGLVSVFLRVLEYFEGIIFLTTNRVNAFDKAVRSRVHMAIYFPKLTLESRRKLWMTFIMKISEDSEIEWCDDPFLDALADRELNGRQIKNAVRTAHALSVSRNEHLATRHLLTSLESLTQFDAQLEPDFADSPADAPTPGRHTIGRKRQRLW